VAVGDLNGDGILDLAVTNQENSSVRLFPEISRPKAAVTLADLVPWLLAACAKVAEERAVRRLHLLCATLLHRGYPRLTQPPLNLQAEELLLD
jgi:hypothetical protein